VSAHSLDKREVAVAEGSLLISASGERLIAPRLGAKAENVPIGIFDPHFISPLVVLGLPQNPGAAGLVLFIKSRSVLDAYPNPGSGLSLATLGRGRLWRYRGSHL
jgi:hypothetical protein